MTVTRYTSEDASQDPRGGYVAHEDFDAAVALLREWGTAYDDPKYAGLPDYGQRISEFLERVDSPSAEQL